MQTKQQVLIEAIEACIPDLEHYVATHGPGPDLRLEQLQQALANIKS